MPATTQLIDDINKGLYDAAFEALYGAGRVARQRARYTEAVAAFETHYGVGRQVALFSTPGRTEIAGNHTDHNNGLVLAAAVDLDIIAVASKCDEGLIRVRSAGFDSEDAVALDSLAPCVSEMGRSAALVRGMAAGIARLGGQVGGFVAYTTSDILKGSGLSSSAAFEVCLGTILNHLYNEGRFSATDIAIAGQRAENLFYGKPSGLMDQLACASGGVVAVDFGDPAGPDVTGLRLDLTRQGHRLVITDTRGSHADLTAEYAAVRSEMEQVAAALGQKVLRQVAPAVFYDAIPRLRTDLGDRAVLRAMHFYAECERVERMADTIREGRFDAFLELVRAGGHSSFEYNQNAYSIQVPAQQAVPIALALSQQVLAGQGAARLQGGGFGGTIQAFVPEKLVHRYHTELERVFGAGACYLLGIRGAGCTPVRPV